MQIYVQDVFAIRLFSFTYYDTVSYYDITLTSLFINYCAISIFYQHSIHDTTYDTPIISSLIISMLNGMDTHNIINLTVQAGWEAGLAACPSH
jgi:hypothetical protein